jgi:hypothetical protein
MTHDDCLMTAYRDEYEMGFEAYYTGTSVPPEHFTAEQRQWWQHGWRAADKREEYLFDFDMVWE